MAVGGGGWLGMSGWLWCGFHAGEAADLGEVVGEYAVSAPDPNAGDAGQLGPIPVVASFEVVDSPFGSSSPFDVVAKGSSVLELAAGGTGFASAWDRHAPHAELV